MKDSDMLTLYLDRKEAAIEESRKAYGKLIRHVLSGILSNTQDIEECENDTYLAAWQSIRREANQPDNLKAYLVRIARNAGCKRLEYLTAAKRNPEALISLDELGDCIADGSAQDFTDTELSECINGFLGTLKAEHRKIFLLRYWRFLHITEISERTGFSKSKVEAILYRTRNKFRTYLKDRGFLS